jgi:hypothetical protein
MNHGTNKTTGPAPKVTQFDERPSGRHRGGQEARADLSAPEMVSRPDDASLSERRLSEELDRGFDKQSTKFILTLNEVERAQLMILLERELHETHVEARRTETPSYQDRVHDQEAVLNRLIEKLRHV